jgi:hypothetical protein
MVEAYDSDDTTFLFCMFLLSIQRTFDARGRVTAPFVEPTEPVGETAELRTAATASRTGFVLVNADREDFRTGDAEDLVGTIKVL